MQTRLTSKEQKELVLKNLKFVHYLVNKLDQHSYNYEDLVSVGTIGLIKAASTFDESKNIKFSTYAARCINNEIFMYFRKENSHMNDISLNDTIHVDKDGNELTICDILASPEKDFTEQIEDIYNFMRLISITLNLLTGRERLMMLCKIAGYTQKYTAKILNITQSYVSRLEKKLIKKVKSYLENTEQFKEVFSMAIVGNLYQITFSSKDIEHFNQIFATFLKNLTSTEELPDFEVINDDQRILIQIPAHPESFSFIAQIIQEIDNYSLKFVSDKTKLSPNDMCLPNVKTTTAAKNDSITEKSITDKTAVPIIDTTPVKEEKEIVENSTIKSNVSTSVTEIHKSPESTINSNVNQILDYILSKDSFTTKELKQHFPSLPPGPITCALRLAKSQGLISFAEYGKYKVNKKN